LQAWEQSSAGVRTFACDFTRFEYDNTFGTGDPNKAKFIDRGRLKYSSPDKGAYYVDEPRPEQWICDGRSIIEYDYTKKEVIEHRLPPQLQGKAIGDGPLPFLFGASATKLNQRYFLRLVTPADRLGKEIWLQAYPRYQPDAANFARAELILVARTLQPYALALHLPNGNRQTYVFEGIVINDPLGFLKGDPFVPRVPLGWQRVVDDSATSVRVGGDQPQGTRR